MRIQAWGVGVGTAVFLSACSGSSQTGSSSVGTNGQGPTSTSTTGRHSSSGGVSTGSYTSSGGTSSGTTSGGSTGSSTTTGGNGTTTGTTTGTTSSGSTTGTTGYVAGPPYSGYDSGMPPEGMVDQGCTPAAPFRGGFGYCVSCRTTSDCATGQFCDSTSQCVSCRSAADCPTGDVCNTFCYRINQEPYYVCNVGCQLDCRSPDAGPNFCNPGTCDGDAGGCLSEVCYRNSDCVVNGLGACDFSNAQFYGYGTCTACTQDAGGCGPDELCVFDPNTGTDVCQLSCLVDAGVCGQGTYCSDAGSCQSGCQNSNDCIGSSSGSICHQGACVGCITAANCPDYNSGCNPQYSSGSPSCGYCTSDQDCPSSLHCEANKSSTYYTDQCACHADSECPPDAPVCVGLNTALGFPAGSGRCACTDSSQCPSQQGVQYVCESRYPYTVFNGSYGAALGGACIAPCNVDLSGTDLTGTDCASAGIGAVNPQKGIPYGTLPPPIASVCNAGTGYCVPCAQDTDCYSPNNAPATAPNCVAFPNGLDPNSGEPTGGGQCACSDTSQCNDGYACWNAGINGTCKPACSITDGTDSCNPYRQYYYYTPPINPFCNTWTGACVQCLDNWGCTNVVDTYIDGLYAYPGFAANQCTSNGTCVGCVSDSDCPSSAPNCTQGFCGFCSNSAQCYEDAGFSCIQPGPYNAGTCLITGCVGDSNQVATDAGTPCPSTSPYCTTSEICSGTCTFTYICSSCRQDYPTYHGDCSHYPPGAYYGYCNSQVGKCQYYYN